MQALDKPDPTLRPLANGSNGSSQRSHKPDAFGRIIGQSDVMRTEIHKAERFSRFSFPVFICGETGTGKEVFARAIHDASPRADFPFVPVNCTALPHELIESELFGHEAGAFTGANRRQRGLVEEAEHGTLFLDEINSLPMPMQPKLLRFLQESEYRPLGGGTLRHADVRIISASNEDLAKAVASHTFREDLLYRLQVLIVILPPLRARRGDIPLLVDHLISRLSPDAPQSAIRNPRLKMSSAALRKLMAHDWPGNIRELENIIQRALALSSEGIVEASDVDLPDSAPAPANESFQSQKNHLIWDWEHGYLSSLMARHRGNITQAAHEAGKDRRTLYELLRKHNLLTRCKTSETESLTNGHAPTWSISPLPLCQKYEPFSG